MVIQMKNKYLFSGDKKVLDKLNISYHLIYKLHPKDDLNNYKKFKSMVYEFVLDTSEIFGRI